MNITKMLPITKKLILPILNLPLFGQRNRFRIIMTGKNYKSIETLWGLFKYEEGEKYEVILEGTEAYANAVMSHFEKKGITCRKSYL